MTVSQTTWAGKAQPVNRFCRGLAVLGSNSGLGEAFRSSPDRYWGPLSLLRNGYRVSFRRVKRPGRGVGLPPHLAPRLKKEQSYVSISSLGLHGLFQGEFSFIFISLNNIKKLIYLIEKQCAFCEVRTLIYKLFRQNSRFRRSMSFRV